MTRPHGYIQLRESARIKEGDILFTGPQGDQVVPVGPGSSVIGMTVSATLSKKAFRKVDPGSSFEIVPAHDKLRIGYEYLEEGKDGHSAGKWISIEHPRVRPENSQLIVRRRKILEGYELVTEGMTSPGDRILTKEGWAVPKAGIEAHPSFYEIIRPKAQAVRDRDYAGWGEF